MIDEEATYWALFKLAAKLIATALIKRMKEAPTGQSDKKD